MKEVIMKYNDAVEKLMDRIRKDESAPSNIAYFLDQLRVHHIDDQKDDKKAVYLFGASIPEEVIRAMDLEPVSILGGSFHMGNLAEDTFPRDVDPVVRSAYGVYKLRMCGNEDQGQVIIPYHNDSFRKLSWLIRSEGCKVFGFDMPSVKNMDKSRGIYHSNLKKMVRFLEESYKIRLKPYKLYAACRQVGKAKSSIQRLIRMYCSNPGVISAEVLYAIMSCYYAAKDLSEYEREVLHTISEISTKRESHDKELPNVLLLGSPLFFPNDKVLAMIGDLGAHATMAMNESAMFLQGCELGREESVESMLESVSNHYFDKNFMPLNVDKGCKVEHDMKNIDGVVFHVLKGEVVYDYDLLKYEKHFKKKDIPVLRIETDYSPEDKEQLKIRIEAFIEMLRHRRGGGIFDRKDEK